MSGEGAQMCSCYPADGTALRNVVFMKIVHGNRFICQVAPIGQSPVNVLKNPNLQDVFPFSSF